MAKPRGLLESHFADDRNFDKLLNLRVDYAFAYLDQIRNQIRHSAVCNVPFS